MAEWLKAPVLKTGSGLSRSWVRIPPPPPHSRYRWSRLKPVQKARLERRKFNGLNSAAPSTCKAFSIELRELTALGYPGGDSILPNQPRRDSDVCLSSARCKGGKQCHTAVNEQCRPLHIIRVVRCEPNRRPANIDRLSNALVGNQGK